MLVPYFRNGGMIGVTLDFNSEERYSVPGAAGPTNVELISVSVNGASTIYSATVDCSTITANDALIITTQGETGGGQNNNSIVTLTAEGTPATFDRSTTNAAGAAHVSISRIEGSVVAGNASVNINMEYAIGLARQSFIFYRLVGGAGASLSDSSENETSGQPSISTDVTVNSGDMIISSAYFSNDQGHSFSISNGTLTETTGVVNGSGSGDAMYSTDAVGITTITFNRSGASNTQGDAIVAVAYSGGSLEGNKRNSGIWDLSAVAESLGSAVQEAAPGQVQFTTTGANAWVVPTGVTSISVVAVGAGGGGGGSEEVDETGGGGGGGALAYVNNISVTPGETLTAVVGAGGNGGPSGGNGTAGGNSRLERGLTALVEAGGGAGGQNRNGGGNGGAVVIGSGGSGGSGGAGFDRNGEESGGGGGGAGGYSGNGGDGGSAANPTSATSGQGGAGGGGGGGISNTSRGGGGVGILGEGASGAAGGQDSSGDGGSGGANGTFNGGLYGAGGAGDGVEVSPGGDGANGAVRIIWGTGRSFPSTNTGDV